MTSLQIPPSGVPAEFTFEVPAPDGLTTLGGVRLHFTFAVGRPASGLFFPRLLLGGERHTLSDSAMGARSITEICQLPEALQAPLQVRVTVNEDGSLEPGNTVTVYAWGAQTENGEGALNPDEGGNPSLLTATIEVGQIRVLTWEEWNRVTGANQGEETGS